MQSLALRSRAEVGDRARQRIDPGQQGRGEMDGVITTQRLGHRERAGERDDAIADIDERDLIQDEPE